MRRVSSSLFFISSGLSVATLFLKRGKYCSHTTPIHVSLQPLFQSAQKKPVNNYFFRFFKDGHIDCFDYINDNKLMVVGGFDNFCFHYVRVHIYDTLYFLK
jgi:hypothetical protein